MRGHGATCTWESHEMALETVSSIRDETKADDIKDETKRDGIRRVAKLP
jgi:hypothetical protein